MGYNVQKCFLITNKTQFTMPDTISIPADYSPKSDLLKDRVILITGAGDGIGRAVSKCYAAHGATIVLVGRTTHKLESVYDEIIAAGHTEPLIFSLKLDSATDEDYQGLAGGISQELGRLDGLLHNAAELGSLMPVDHYPTELWLRTLNVNLNAPFQLTRACLPLLRQSDDASILFTSTNPYEKSSAYWGAYGVSKQAIEAFMHILADELETNTSIRVNAVDPGSVHSLLRSTAYPGEDPNDLPGPDTLTPGYLYLMGPDSHGIHGQLVSLQPTP